MSDANLLRIIILLLGAAVLAIIYFKGKMSEPAPNKRKPRVGEAWRVEPSLSDVVVSDEVSHDIEDPGLREELEKLSRTLAADRKQDARSAQTMLEDTQENDPVPEQLPLSPQRPNIGVREQGSVERIITLFVLAEEGTEFGGPDIMVAAEKVGLVFGDKGAFHRLLDGYPEKGPVFSVANMVKPGSFDAIRISDLRTSGLTFFITLPAPVGAIEAWDMMLPTAERIAELLQGQLVDEERNALARQTIQHIRDDLRNFDRNQERNLIQPRW